jgi:hypothetical protein
MAHVGHHQAGGSISWAYCIGVGQFSEDGLWWWDGTTWIATAQIVLPQLPVTEFELSGQLKGARRFMRRASLFFLGNTSISLALVSFCPG